MEQIKFSFEDLEVWQKAVKFIGIVLELTESVSTQRKHYRVIEQLEAASTSIALNIAEGKGRYSKKEFIQFLYFARGSLNETITLLILFNKMKWIDEIQFKNTMIFAEEISKMISGLINSVRYSGTLNSAPKY